MMNNSLNSATVPVTALLEALYAAETEALDLVPPGTVGSPQASATFQIILRHVATLLPERQRASLLGIFEGYNS